MKKILGVLICSFGLWAQSQITLSTSAPTGVTQINTQRVGNQGNSTYFYWVVANFAIGQGSITNSQIILAPDSMSGGNYVKVLWGLVNGVSTYDILRTTTPFVPSPCTCSIVTGLSASTNSYNNTSNTLSGYTYSPAPGAMATIRLDNQNFTQPVIYVSAPVNSIKYVNLPTASSAKGLTYLVVDSSSSSTCTAGGGTITPALCWSSGSAWIAIGGGGGGGITGLTLNVIPKATSSTTIGDSSVSDDGTTVSTTEPVKALSVATGGTPPTVMAGTGGLWAGGEGTAPTPVAGADILYADASSHTIMQCLNGASCTSIGGGVITSGSLALATGSISSGSCQTVTAGSVNSASAPLVGTTDVITFTPNASIKAVTGYAPSTSGGLTITAYPTAGYVNFDVCNWTSGSITPGAVTLNWKVVQ